MRLLSETYKELALRVGRYPTMRMELYSGSRGNWTDTVEQEFNGETTIVSVTYTNGEISEPSRFETGLVFCGSVEIKMHGVPIEPFAANKKIKLYSGFYDPLTKEIAEAIVGEFFIETATLDDGTLTINASDKMFYSEQKFNALKLTYPCYLIDVMREIFNQMGFILPEDYELEINPVVRAPAWSKPNMTEGVYSNGSFYVEDPLGYGITMPGETNPTKGHRYSASGYGLSCREALGSIAKMQLGNCFINNEGIPCFSSYKVSSDITDEYIIDLDIGKNTFTIKKILYNYMGYDVESVTLFKRPVYETNGEIMYYTNIPSDLPASYEPYKSRALGKTFNDGTINRRGLGEIEIGDLLEYDGSLGKCRFFVFGIQYEWTNALFTETIYSFAPNYKGVDREWMNDRDVIDDEDNIDEPVVDDSNSDLPTDTGSGGISVDRAVIINEKDSKYLVHEFKPIEYEQGTYIGYTGPDNQFMVHEMLIYSESVLNDGASSGTVTRWLFPSDWIPTFSRYASLDFDIFSITSDKRHYKRIYLTLNAAYPTYGDMVCYGDLEDGTTIQLTTAGNVNNFDYWNGIGLALMWTSINAPGYTLNDIVHKYGVARGALYVLFKGSKTNANTTYYLTRILNNIVYPFSSEEEYEAAVGLTYEPLKLVAVEDVQTVYSKNQE